MTLINVNCHTCYVTVDTKLPADMKNVCMKCQNYYCEEHKTTHKCSSRTWVPTKRGRKRKKR